MLDRNRRIKKAPEKFQLCKEKFDIIITAEERVYDQVIEFMESNPPVDNQPVHVINIDIQDNHEEATMGAFLICDMVSMVKYVNFIQSFARTANVFIIFLCFADGIFRRFGQWHRWTLTRLRGEFTTALVALRFILLNLSLKSKLYQINKATNSRSSQ